MNNNYFSTIELINAVLVQVTKNEERMTPKGLFLPATEDKASNYGYLLKKPTFVTKEFETFKEIVDSMNEGCTIFFNAKATYNIIKLDYNVSDPNSEYLIIPLDQIQAFTKTTKT